MATSQFLAEKKIPPPVIERNIPPVIERNIPPTREENIPAVIWQCIVPFLTLGDRARLLISKYYRTILYSSRLDLSPLQVELANIAPFLQQYPGHITGLNVITYHLEHHLKVVKANLARLTTFKLTQREEFGCQKILIWAANYHHNSDAKLSSKLWNIHFLRGAVNLTELTLDSKVTDYKSLTCCQNLLRLDIAKYSGDLGFLRGLPQLKYFRLAYTFTFPIANMPKLEEVVLSTKETMEVPEFVGCPKLARLTLEASYSITFPPAFAPTVNLSKFTIKGAPLVSDFTILASQPNLRQLMLNHTCADSNFSWMANCPNLEIVALLPSFINDREVDLTSLAACPKLTTLTLGQGKWNYSFLPTCSALLNLTVKILPNTAKFPPPTYEYSGLQKLEASECTIQDPNFLKRCPNLHNLAVYDGRTTDLGFLAACPHLETLILRVYSIEGDCSILNQCPKLKYVRLETELFTKGTVSSPHEVMSWGNGLLQLGARTKSTNINLDPFPKLEELILTINRGMPLKKERIRLKGGTTLKELQINVTHPSHIACDDILFTDRLPELKKLEMTNSWTNNLDHCPNVTHISMLSGLGLDSLSSLLGCPALEVLNLSNCTQLKSIPPLAGCPNLKKVNLFKCTAMTDVNFLRNCQIELLILEECDIADITALGTCPRLTKLDLSLNKLLVDLTPLSQCRHFKCLDLSYSRGVRILTPLGKCPMLTELKLVGLDRVEEIVGLAQCRNLRVLNIADCYRVKDLPAYVQANPTVECIYLGDGRVINMKNPPTIAKVIRWFERHRD